MIQVKDNEYDHACHSCYEVRKVDIKVININDVKEVALCNECIIKLIDKLS